MITKLISTSGFALIVTVSLSGCAENSSFVQEGARFRQEVATINQATIPQGPSKVAMRKASKKDKEVISIKKDAVPKKKVEPGEALSNYPEKPWAKTKGGGALKTYSPKPYESPDFDQGRHASELKDMEKRQQENILSSSRTRR